MWAGYLFWFYFLELSSMSKHVSREGKTQRDAYCLRRKGESDLRHFLTLPWLCYHCTRNNHELCHLSDFLAIWAQVLSCQAKYFRMYDPFKCSSNFPAQWILGPCMLIVLAWYSHTDIRYIYQNGLFPANIPCNPCLCTAFMTWVIGPFL